MSKPPPSDEALELADLVVSFVLSAELAEAARRIDAFAAERVEKIAHEHLAKPLYSRRLLEERVAAADAMADVFGDLLKHCATFHHMREDSERVLAAYRALSPGERK